MDDFSIDPVLGSEIMDLLGVQPYQLDNPRTYRKIHEVVKYFVGKENPRQTLWKVLAKNAREDKLDSAWMFVNLRSEREAIVRKLDPKDFENDIAQEIADGYLTRIKIDRVKSDIAVRKAKRERERLEAEDERLAKATERRINKAIDQFEPKIDEIEQTLTQLEAVNGALQKYE